MEIVGIVGAGTMGVGIAQLALEAGHEVVFQDVDTSAIEQARERILAGLGRRAASLELDADTIEDWAYARLTGLREVPTLDALADECDVVIEAAVEDLDLKQTIFRALDAAAAPEVILATNTSALRVAEIAAPTATPSRVLGLHFFNPAPVMKLVEVVVTELTDPAVADRATRLVESWGRTAVRCADAPGFIVNRVNRPFTIEALRMVEAGEVSVEAIDAAVREGGFPMGPFELMDLIGIDVNLAAARGVWDGLGRPDRLRPSPIQERLVEGGRLGRKTGEGFYRYASGKLTGPAPEFAGSGREVVTPAAIRERILAAVATEAQLAVNDDVASSEDIDIALRLGAGHPHGPFEAA